MWSFGKEISTGFWQVSLLLANKKWLLQWCALDKGGLGETVSKPADNIILMEKRFHTYIYIIIKVTGLKSNPEHSTPMMAFSIALKNRLISVFDMMWHLFVTPSWDGCDTPSTFPAPIKAPRHGGLPYFATICLHPILWGKKLMLRVFKIFKTSKFVCRDSQFQ